MKWRKFEKGFLDMLVPQTSKITENMFFCVRRPCLARSRNETATSIPTTAASRVGAGWSDLRAPRFFRTNLMLVFGSDDPESAPNKAQWSVRWKIPQSQVLFLQTLTKEEMDLWQPSPKDSSSSLRIHWQSDFFARHIPTAAAIALFGGPLN